MGITDLNRKYTLTELAKGNVMFAATGVTSGYMLDGVKRTPGGAITHTLIMRSQTGTVRFVHAEHNLSLKGAAFTGGFK
jgi:fructose-1,6-bisphosphatase II / sedoheptulose-1,7-bisphosphatase